MTGEPSRPLPKHWKDVARAARNEADLDNSDAARHAGEALDSPCVVVLSVNREEATFEARCFGDTAAWRSMADQMADVTMAALDADLPSSPIETGENE